MSIQRRKVPSGTFRENKLRPIHRWYPYIEGYSYNLVENEINLMESKPNSIYDPFGGSGTTPLVSSIKGIKSFYSETNPAMQFVADTKINITKKSYGNWPEIKKELDLLLEKTSGELVSREILYIDYQGFEKYYTPEVLSDLMRVKEFIMLYCRLKESKSLATLALISILVYVSKMVRRSDLRYAKDHEKTEENADVINVFNSKLLEIMADIELYGDELKDIAVKLADDSRKVDLNEQVDAVITSPPYLNGTNYIRNTKLELKMLDLIYTEKDLPQLHSKGIIAGINSVSRRNKIPEIMDLVKPYVEKLNDAAYDSRIPIMVAGYFYDMNVVINRLSNVIRKDGDFILDIGDSQFAGVHIPTHSLLVEIAENQGFTQFDEEILRNRRSNNGMELSQRVLRFRKK